MGNHQLECDVCHRKVENTLAAWVRENFFKDEETGKYMHLACSLVRGLGLEKVEGLKI